MLAYDSSILEPEPRTMQEPDMNEHEPTESSPLLPSLDESEGRPPPSPEPTRWLSRKKLIFWMMMVVLLISLGDQWSESPQTRIFESVICYRYYEKRDPSKLLLSRKEVGPGAIGGVDEMWCKVDDVQSDLAMLRGWQQMFDGFPSLLLAIPAGYAADRYGRKPLLGLGLLGFVLRASWMQFVTWFWQAFDVRLSWLSTILGSIGGGNAVTSTLFFVVLADITPEAERAGMFLRAGAFNLLAALVMPPLAAALMEVNPWIPNLGGTILIIASLPIFALLPETLNYMPSTTSSASYAEGATWSSDQDTSFGKRHRTISRLMSRIRRSLVFLTDDWRVPVLILPFLIHMLVTLLGQLLLQYLSKRYALKLSKAILLQTIRTGVIVLLLFVILPYLSTAIMRWFKLSAQRKDLYLARISTALLAIGFTLVGLAPNIPIVAIGLTICALGHGAALMLRSFLTSLLPKHHIARVYSIISIVDTIGAMFGMPLLSGLFKHGLALGGFWVGLPFYFIGIAAASFTVLLFMVSLRKGEDKRPDIDIDVEE